MVNCIYICFISNVKRHPQDIFEREVDIFPWGNKLEKIILKLSKRKNTYVKVKVKIHM